MRTLNNNPRRSSTTNATTMQQTFSRRTKKKTMDLKFLRFCVTTVIAFVAGCLVGILVTGSSLNCRRPDIDVELVAPVKKKERQQDNGWHSIDVFNGDSSKHFKDTLDPQQEWFSQCHQDQALFALFRGKREGFFVDLAANDATLLSNTFALEQKLGWRGLCIEPNPIYWSNLTHRDCQVVAAVVGKTRMEEIRFRLDAGDHGGIAGDGFDNGKKFKASSSPMYTVTLLEIFERYQVPNQIDYVSLDVEGAEEFIMSSNPSPLEKYRISVLTVERPTAGMRQLFDKFGYEHIMRLSRWGETLWAHKSVMDSLDLEAVKAFHPKVLRQKGLM